jgi:DNA invertase Pin-like site-specific DNA recombinase
MTTVIGYARSVSGESAQMEAQYQRLLAAGAAEVMMDVGAANSNRPQFQQLLAKVQAQQVQEIMVTSFDRLALNMAELQRLLSLFSEAEVNLRVLDQHLDLSTPQGRLMVNLLQAIAEWEVQLLSES